MSPFELELENTKTDTSLVTLEPALNVFGSMLLVSNSEDDPGIHEWVAKTRASMTAEERFRHQLVIIGFHHAVLPNTSGMTFEAYLADLESTPPSELRERLLTAYGETCKTEASQRERGKPVDWDEVLLSAKNYVDFLKFRFGDEKVEEDVETRAYEYVIDPAALKQLVTGHLRWFWKNHLQAEWARVRPMLEQIANAFNQVDIGEMTRLDLIKFVTGKDTLESKWGDNFESAKTLAFIPNPHFGPYIRREVVGDNLFIYFGAHMPEGSDLRIPELDRAEIVSRLSALADDTRLKILQMIAENGQMRSQEIMDAIKLSQPSISRYLSQLTATGYLQEKREGGAKVYFLNQDRIDQTLKAVNVFLQNRP